MAVLGLVLAIVGVLPVLAATFLWSQGYHRSRQVLAFRRSLPIDIVLTTSAVEPAIHGTPVTRPLTGYGQVRGVANCARALTAHYPRKDIVIHLSGFIRNRLDRDLVSLGGPAKNEITRHILREIPERKLVAELTFDDIGNNIKVVDAAGREISIAAFDTQIQDGVPQVDICLIAAMTRSRPDARTTRSILCAGFTSYGTAAASEYMFLDLPRFRLRRLNNLLQSGHHPVRPVGDFLIVAQARFSRGECTDIEPIFQTALKAD